jgi:membrane dipeptidase
MTTDNERLSNPGFFDAHCDTVIKVLDDGEDFLQTGAKHLSFAGMTEADVRAQVFACFVLSAHHPGRERERALEMIDAVHEMADATDGGLTVVTTTTALNAAFDGGTRAAILALEGADPLGDRADAVHEFYERGIRSLILAWQDNAFSGTAFGSNTPLTAQGRRLLGLCEDLRIVVDVSHLSDAAFDEVARLSERPFVATHSNCRALSPNLRNLTDNMIRTLADRGGVMGINLSPSFLDAAFAAAVAPLQSAAEKPGVSQTEKRKLFERMLAIPRPPLTRVVEHILHAIDVGGEDCVGFGGDLDGIGQTPADLDTVADYRRFPAMLRDAGLSQRQVEKVCYDNFRRTFTEILGD